MMNVTFRCPHCDKIAHAELHTAQREIACPACAAKWQIGDAAAGKLERCLICPSKELYVRKDFSQATGVAIVVFGFVVSSVFWYYRMPLWTYGVLFATALIDVVLYLTVGNLLQCYRCQAQYRGVIGLEDHQPFDLETNEKHRQQRIRLAQSGARQVSGE
jgi:DNA-directed RNA polymerase subunit RPC12/RpoP